VENNHKLMIISYLEEDCPILQQALSTTPTSRAERIKIAFAGRVTAAFLKYWGADVNSSK